MIYRRSAAAGIEPEPLLTVSEWADAHRRLPQKSSAEPGPWRTDRTPYLREIMDAMSATSTVEEVVVMKGAQIGGTEAILNVIGYVIAHAPGPILAVQPTVETAKRYSRQRIEPLIASTPALTERVSPARSRVSSNTVLAKDFLGGILVMTGANSAVGLRSMPARWLLLDEIDGYPEDVDGEGDPVDLAEARQRTFARRKRIKVSTPTIAGASKIEAAYLASDQRRYHVPCPGCGHMAPLVFQRDRSETGHYLEWPEADPGAAHMRCRPCGAVIDERHKTAILARGEWRAAVPGDARVRGYHLSALYSPAGWLSWAEIARRWTRAHKDRARLQAFVNTVLGETWQAEAVEAPEWEPLYRRREPYTIGSVPAGALFLTAGVDVQKDRLVYEVVGWGRERRSWSVDYGVLPGETADLQRGPWAKLDDLLARHYDHAGGTPMPVRVLAVDSGYNTQQVYAWARRYPMARVIAVKGQAGGGVLLSAPSPVDVSDRGRRLQQGYRVWSVCGPIAKAELYGWLRLQLPTDESGDPPGYCRFPEYGPEYFRELTAEQLVKTRHGFEWQQIPGRDNHALDARVYARAAASACRLDRMTETEWGALERSVGIEPAAPPAPPPTPPLPTPPSSSPGARPSGWIQRRERGWLTARR